MKLSILIVAIVFCGCAGAPPVAGDGWQAGMAEIDITPPVGYRMAGYFDERFSTGLHDPLKAKALVLRQGGREVALVFCDLLGMSLHVSQKARAEASRATGIPVANIVIAATHSHTGPLFDDVREDVFHREAIAKFGRDPEETMDYPAVLSERLVQVIVQAARNLEPAELEAGITPQPGIAFNRRYYMKNGKVTFNPGQLNPNIVGPAGPVDSDVGILMVRSVARAQPMGGLTVFAMHCDTTGGTEYSADYPYAIEQSLRKVFGSNYVSAFGAGACGDVNHVDVSRKVPVKGFDVAQALGDKIGATILADLPHLKPVEQPSLAAESKTLMLPLQTVTPQELTEARKVLPQMRDTNVDFYAKVRAVKALDLVERGAALPAEIQVFRLDRDTAIVCLPAEIFAEFGLAIKKASPFKQTMVITVCNDRPSYVPTIKAFQEGSYEVINSRVKPGGGEAMVEMAVKMLNQLKGP